MVLLAWRLSAFAVERVMSEQNKIRIPWGSAQNEVALLKQEIEAAITAGRSIRSIYVELSNANKITVSQTRFYIYVAPIRDELHQQNLLISKLITPSASAAVSPQTINPKSKTSEFGQLAPVADQPMSPASGNPEALFTLKPITLEDLE